MKLCLGLSITQLLSSVGYSTSTALIFDNNNNNNNNNRNSNRSLSSSQKSLKKLLAKARRLEDEGGDDNAANDDQAADEAAEENMEAFLMDYSLKFMKCIPDQVILDADYNKYYGAVIFRLCPSNKCSNTNGCTSGYADFAIDVGTYVDAFLTDQQDNMNWDDENFDGDNMGQCTQYEGDDDGGDAAYYIGPGCTADGTGVKMGVFEDQYCYEESETTFETISNGWSLPYSDGGLVSTQCTDCTDDDGEIREMCLDLYDYSPYRCEADLEYTHYYYDANFEIYRYGKDSTGCNSIHVMQNPKGGFSSEAVWTDAILVVILIAATGVGFYYYSEWWTEQKANLEKIDDDDDEDSQYRLDDDNSAANSGYGDDFSGSGQGQPSGLDESGIISDYKNDKGTSPNAASGTMT